MQKSFRVQWRHEINGQFTGSGVSCISCIYVGENKKYYDKTVKKNSADPD